MSMFKKPILVETSKFWGHFESKKEVLKAYKESRLNYCFVSNDKYIYTDGLLFRVEDVTFDKFEGVVISSLLKVVDKGENENELL